MADLRFKVGAALDASWDVVFGSAIAKAKKARAAIAAEMRASGKEIAGPIKSGSDAAGDALARVGKGAQGTGVVLGRVADGARERFEMLSKGLKKLPADLSLVAREAERELGRIERAQARSALGLPSGGGRGGKGGPNMGYRMGYWASRNFSAVTPTLNMGMNVARDIAHGAGVDLDIGSQVGKSVERQDLATRLSIQGYKSYKAGTDDPNGRKVSASTLSTEAFAHGNAVGMDPNEILKAQTAFVDLTGDLATARGLMTDLGKVSNATGTDMEQTANAAAGISKSLEATYGADTQGRIKAVQDILRNLAGQGKEGAVELKNYASQMGKVAVAANQIGGDRKEAFNLVGMVVQESRAHGGSTTATQAASSVGALFNEIATDSARKHPHLSMFKDLYDVDAKGNRTSIKSPVKIIEAAVLASKGDPVTLRKMFSSKLALRAVEGFAGTYRDAERQSPGSGKAVLEAELENLHKATISEQDVREANTETLNETKRKVQVFNNELAKITDDMMATIAPSMASAGGGLVTAAHYVADFVALSVRNPLAGASIALGAAVAKAGVEQSVRWGIEKMFAGALGPVALTAAAVTLVSMAAIDEAVHDDEKREYAGGQDIAAAQESARRIASGKATPADLVEAEKTRKRLAGDIQNNEDTFSTKGQFTTARGFFSAAADTFAGDSSGFNAGASEHKAFVAAMKALTTAIQKNTDAAGKAPQRPTAPRQGVDHSGRGGATPLPGKR